MTKLTRGCLRLATLVFAIAMAAVLFVGSFLFVWRDAMDRAPDVGYRITPAALEKQAMGLYLYLRRAQIETPPDADDVEDVTFVIEPGESVGSITARLMEKDLITDGDLFRRVLQYHGADSAIEAGRFTLRRSMRMEEVMDELQHGRLLASMVTIPEGWRAEEVAALLEQSGVTSAAEFLSAVRQGSSDYSFLQDRPEGAGVNLEGFLFPDTYMLPEDTPAVEVLDTLLTNWDTRVGAELREAASAQGLTLYEVVTLASIVEREARVAEERPLIAGVYLNRLAIGMPLQADPTVQYALGYNENTGRWWNPLTLEDIDTTDSPYNSYKNGGLPPGPICNPGLASISSVVEPEESEYLYFLARGDGSHAFATTFEEHLQNQQLYGDE